MVKVVERRITRSEAIRRLESIIAMHQKIGCDVQNAMFREEHAALVQTYTMALRALKGPSWLESVRERWKAGRRLRLMAKLNRI